VIVSFGHGYCLIPRGVFVALPARLAQMLSKNPKGLDGSINPAATNPAMTFGFLAERHLRRFVDRNRYRKWEQTTDRCVQLKPAFQRKICHGTRYQTSGVS